MAETKLTNVVVPEIYNAYTQEKFVGRSRFFRSGVIERNSMIDSNLAGGGSTFNLPFTKQITSRAGIPAETGTQTVNNLSAAQEIIRRQMRVNAFGTNAIATIFAGSNQLENVMDQFVDMWAKEFDLASIYTLQGIINDNLTNDSGDLVLDISDNASPYISDDRIIQTMAKHGENGVNRTDNLNGNFNAILMHSNVYNYLKSLDAITFVPISSQPRPLAFYNDLQVIVDDNCIKQSESGGYTYTTILLKPGALQIGFSTNGYETISYERVEARGMGVDEVYLRQVFAIHSPGFAWQGASMAGLSPTDTELAKASNWNRVASLAQNCKFAALLHDIPAAWNIA